MALAVSLAAVLASAGCESSRRKACELLECGAPATLARCLR